MKYLIYIIIIIYNLNAIASTSSIIKQYEYTGFTIEIYHSNDDLLNYIEPVISKLYVDTSNKIIRSSGSNVYYQTCNDIDDLYCLFGGGINLSVPKKTEWPDEWNDGIARYVHIGTDTLKILGNTYKIEVILRTSIKDSNAGYNTHEIYYYSVNDGLIAYTFYYNDDKVISNYISTSEQGVKLDALME